MSPGTSALDGQSAAEGRPSAGAGRTRGRSRTQAGVGERFNRKSADIFEVEDEISRQIAERLQLKFSGDEEKMADRSTSDAVAYDLYLKARHHWGKRTPESIQVIGESHIAGRMNQATFFSWAGKLQLRNLKTMSP